MTIQSMTGFGRFELTQDNFSILVELKSVNNRFKDMRFKIPSTLNSLEIPLRKKITDGFSRGSFDIYISSKKSSLETQFDHIDFTKVNSFINAFKQNLSKENSLDISPTDFLRSDFYKDNDVDHTDQIATLVGKVFDQAVCELRKSREDEGAKLVQVLQDHMQEYQKLFGKIEAITSRYQKSVEDKLRKRVADFSQESNLNESRLLQEVIFYLEKLDVHEEMNRIVAHLDKLKKILIGEKEIGRQIDFLVQELGRETNTIGSKSGDIEISELVVQMKVQLEKIREQGLNLE